MVAELPLILISMYYYGWTAHFARTKGYYIVGHLKGPHTHDARLMYAGALLSLIGGAYSIIFVPIQILGKVDITHITPFWSVFSSRRYESTTRGGPPNALVLYVSMMLMIYGWVGAWLFWVGYVRLAGDL
jgi:hypothetical protein